MQVNFRHLYYFWVTARAGGVVRAAAQQHVTPHTLSGQIARLEEHLGHPLFRRSGRQMELTDEGRIALRYADEIFSLGVELENAVRHKPDVPRTLEFRVGVADSVAKGLRFPS